MYIMYYDSGTTNTRAYLLKDGAIVRSMAKAIGAKNSALERDNTRLVGELYSMYENCWPTSRSPDPTCPMSSCRE